jgi:hypothetical protein
MEIIRKTNVLIKTERKFVIHRPEAREQVWCGRCEEQMVTAQEAALMNGTGARAIFRLIEDGNIHFVEMGSETFVCPNLTIPVPPEE